LEFNQSEGRKPISSLVNFALIGQNPIRLYNLLSLLNAAHDDGSSGVRICEGETVERKTERECVEM